jgi:hypothetical protein
MPELQAEAVTQLRERGYAVLENLFPPEEIADFRAILARRYEALGSPRTWARPPLEPEPGIEISVVGLVFHQLARHCPALGARFITPPLVGVARGLLGDDMHLEYTAGIVNHGERPFFPWHAHVGGVDNITYRKQGIFPRFTRSERITMLLYLDDLTDASGSLLVHPRRIEDPTEPPATPTLEEWPGQVELRCRRGTVVLLEQCVWHAARSKSSAGLRSYLACYFTSSRAPKSSWSDDSLRPWAAENPLLASVLHGPNPR